MNGLAPTNTQVLLLSRRSEPARRRLPFTALCLLILLLFFHTPLAVRADSPAPAQAWPSVTADQSPHSPLVAGIWDLRNRLSHPSLANRRVMLQIGVVGMCIALYIIIWRR